MLFASDIMKNWGLAKSTNFVDEKIRGKTLDNFSFYAHTYDVEEEGKPS